MLGEETQTTKRRWRRKHTVVLVLLAGAVLTLWQPSKYVLLSPGPSRPVTGRIEASLETTKTYPSSGQFNLVTVYVSRATWWEYLVSKTPWSEAESVEMPSRSQDRAGSRADMASSEQTAAMVAEKFVFGKVESVKPEGALVVETIAGKPAYIAGIRAGDVIVEINGDRVTNAEETASAVATSGNKLSVKIKRDSTTKEMSVLVEDGKIGVRISDHYSGKPLLKVDNGEVGGASAGLAMSLAFVDFLTPGDLTAGRTLAATGVINADGSVGAIDGVDFKASGAIKEGVELMFVPKGQAAEVKRQGIKIVEVSSLYEAIEFLCKSGSDDAACDK